MRNRILGAIGVLWGGGILVSTFLRDAPVTGSEAYAAGHSAGVVFSALLFIVGGYYLLRGAR